MTIVKIQGDMSATSGTASAWKKVLADLAKARLPAGRITAPAGARRSKAMVLDMWLSSPARRRDVYGVPIGVGVARPTSLGGAGSVHENGRCLDVGNVRTIGFSNLAPIMRRHGFVNTIPSEPWHWEYRGPEGGGAGGGGIDNTKEDDMSAIISVTKNGKKTLMRLAQHGLAIEETTSTTVAERWKIDNNRPENAIAGANASGILDSWIKQIASGQAAIRGIVSSEVDDITVPAIGDAQLAAFATKVREGLVFPEAEEIAEAVVDEQHDRLAD
jgi:hypothetical protein